MEGLTKKEKQDAKKAFVETESAVLPLVDRSTAENWDCPFKGKAIEEGRALPVGLLAEAGNGVHDGFSEAILAHIDSGGAIGQHDMRQDLEFALRNSRPDVQPEVLKAARPAFWAWCKFIDDILPENILAFDGGEKVGKSGQFAWDCADLGVRYTLELDLLYAGSSPEVLHVVDYKSGWKPWDADAVQDSFQFQSQAALVLQRYNRCRPGSDEPTVKCVSVEVWNTRANRRTYKVEFPRRNLHDYECRIRSMLSTRRTHYDNPPTWPVLEKCRICPAAAICPVAVEPIGDTDEELLRQLVATGARYKALEDIAKARVDANGGNDLAVGPLRFGRNRPKAFRKADAELYDVTPKGKKKNDSDSNDP